MFDSNNDGASLWQESANCRGTDTEMFFPPRNATPKEAKAFCKGCPVVAECLEYAIMYGVSGVWGGTTDKERNRRFKSDLRKSIMDDAKESGTYNYALKV